MAVLVQTRRMPFCPHCGTENPDVAKFCFSCGSALVAAAPPREVRKVVSIVFSDLQGSTAMGEKLDSESLREVMTRYFDAMRAELERHGGVIEKFIGDAIMAVFGLPRLHEDDALRAVRAAADMQRALGQLNDELDRRWGVRLTVRTGVNTGEVVAGDPTAGQRLVLGDTVNVAARLEQAAGAQEVLLGELTYRLVRDYVDAEPVEPLELKGKSEPVPAYRLLRVREVAERPRRLDSPMVGRDAELGLLGRMLDEAIRTRTCRLATVVGEAGVGKSRLIDEFVRSAEDRASFIRGRCLPYGDGITFWPLAEATREAAGIVEHDSADGAASKLAALASEDVVARVASAIGLSAAQFPVEELVWGARKLLETLARKRPLLVLFEDVHWAERTFIDLIDNVVGSVEDAALTIVCTARHDLLERLPDWSSGERSARIVLERLSGDDTAAIAEHLLGSIELDALVRTRIVEVAEGNPLFVEQLLSMLIDEGHIRFEDGTWNASVDLGDVPVPPTIQALLAARLDHLDPEERGVIEPASVAGSVFLLDAVRFLVPEALRDAVTAKTASLADMQLVRPDLSRPLEEEAYRFHHILIRDTAYEGILKRARASYHERFVQWGDSVNREGATEYEEILGYHLEQAYRYLSELGPLDDHGRALGADGARRLAAAGHRAFARGDVPAAANLLGRATALLPENEAARLELLPEYAEALIQLGRFQDAEETLDEAMAPAPAEESALERVRAHASLVRLRLELHAGEPEGWQAEAAIAIAEAMAIFESVGDEAGLARAWRALTWSHGSALRFGLAAESAERALRHAHRAADVRQETRAATAYPQVALFGPTPVSEAIERCEEILGQVTRDRHAAAMVLAPLGSLYAMLGAFGRARDCLEDSRAILRELGLRVEEAATELEAWRVEMLAGDVHAAEERLRVAYAALEHAGERFMFSTVAGLLAQTVYALGRYEEADGLARLSRDLATDNDVDTQTLWRCVSGKLAARRGSLEEGERLVRDAVELLEATDAALFQHDALIDLAHVQLLAGKQTEAAETLAATLEIAERKRSPVLVEALKRMLEAPAETLVR